MEKLGKQQVAESLFAPPGCWLTDAGCQRYRALYQCFIYLVGTNEAFRSEVVKVKSKGQTVLETNKTKSFLVIIFCMATIV